jgi:galactose mutarotase-like enzyme
MVAIMNFPTQRERVLRFGDTTIGVIPDINLVTHFQVGAWQVLYRPVATGNLGRWGIPLMIPNFSKLNNGIFQEKGTHLPSHGFGRLLPWNIVEQTEDSISLQLSSSKTTWEQYPFHFLFTTLIAAGSGTLTYTLTIENLGQEPLPIAPGFHPYFTLPQEKKAQLETDGPPGFTMESFQWDTQPPNNPYVFPHEVTLQVPHAGSLSITELPNDAGAYSLKTMQIWSEPATAADHDFVCFEPVVTSEDGLNRPTDRLNIPAQSSQQIILQLTAQPL